jgi:hypothetical protein
MAVRCFGGKEVMRPPCSLVRFWGDKAVVVDMVAGLLRWWMFGLGGVCGRVSHGEVGAWGGWYPLT